MKSKDEPVPYSNSAVLATFIREAIRKGYMYFVFNGNERVYLHLEIDKKDLGLTKSNARGVLLRLEKEGLILKEDMKNNTRYVLNPSAVRYFRFGDTRTLLYDELPRDFEVGIKFGRRRLHVYGDLLLE